MPIEDHAVVDREGFKVPLIGVSPTTLLQECDVCHDEYPLNEVELDASSKPVCKKCRKENK